ncbi:MAG: methyltransferase domain-containing protein [Pseudomonadota bacterium]
MSEVREHLACANQDRASASVRQREIASWFDKTYSMRGLRYLRPGRAYEVFSRMLGLAPGDSLLDVACGPGLFLEQAQRCGALVNGVDISQVAVRLARERVAGVGLAIGSADHLPYTDGAFDFVTCFGSLERFLSARAALGEMHRVLRDDGRVLLMVRNSRTPSWQALSALGLGNQTGHQGAGSLGHWQQLLKASGFTVLEVHPDQWPLMRWQRLKFLFGADADFASVRRGYLPITFANELIFLCRKTEQPTERV